MFFLCVLSDLRALRGKLFKLESDIIHATLFWTGLAMVEFTTAPEKSVRPVTLLIAAGIVAVMAVAVFFLARNQKEIPAPPSGAPIYIPGLVHPGEPNFEYYRKYIRIENTKASLGITFSRARIAMISGVIANEGDRKLEAVEVKVTLYDVYGGLSKEGLRYPVQPGLPPYKPMEPLEKRGFTVNFESIEQLWNPGKVVVELTGLKYQ